MEQALQTADKQESYLKSMGNVPTGLIPRTVEEMLRIAQLLSRSTIVPKEYQNSPGNVYVAIDMGATLGMAPSQAVQAICVINGKPALYGDAIPAVVYNSPVFDSSVGIQETYDPQTGIATCMARRKGAPESVVRSFSIENAKKANLWGKAGPWQQYPERMLQMRARAFCLRDAFPDVLRGLAIKEEQEDVLEVEAPKPDALTLLLQGLGASAEEITFIENAWDELKVTQAGKIVQCKRFADNAHGLIEMLVSMGATITPSAILAPKPKRGRKPKSPAAFFAAVGNALAGSTQPDPVETAVKEVESRPRGVCAHGVDLLEPCVGCKAEQAALDAEAEAQSTTGKPPEDDLPF